VIEEHFQPWQLDVDSIVEVAPPDDAGPSPPPISPPSAVSEAPPPLERIVEALLFVASETVAPERLCRLIRGLDAEQLQACVRQLNAAYRLQGRPYVIEQEAPGYRLTLRTRFRGMIERLYGGVKEARFSPAAVETLAVIAYRQPIAKADLDAIRGQEGDAPLRQLIRRGLVTIQGHDDAGQLLYGTTPRFLQFFHLKKLDELPRADDLPLNG
jgi:segregation and condensation protein B